MKIVHLWYARPYIVTEETLSFEDYYYALGYDDAPNYPVPALLYETSYSWYDDHVDGLILWVDGIEGSLSMLVKLWEREEFVHCERLQCKGLLGECSPSCIWPECERQT